MEEEIPQEIADIQEITADIPEKEVDSYDELAKVRGQRLLSRPSVAGAVQREQKIR